MKSYDHSKIEKKWQKEWTAKKIYKTEAVSKKKKFYVLDMFPYPSGAGLHVGHPRGYIGSDVYARMKRMQGFNVLHPMGYDAFGLPAEQYAIEHKIHPRKAVEKNVATFEKQLSLIGLSYDWSRKVNTTDPEYYKWTQWIFLQIYNSWYDKTKDKARPIDELVKIFEKSGNKNVDAVCDLNFYSVFQAKDWKGYTDNVRQNILMKYRLAYEGYALVNWCPKLGTVLANDEIVDDKDGNPVSERGGYPVEKVSMRQWFMRITAYADRLLTDLEGLNWSTHIKEIQKNWIGKSEGSEIEFKTSINRNIKVFTTRADTLFGVTYVVLSPEHTNIGEFIVQSKNMADASKYIREAKERAKKGDAYADKEKTGIQLEGVYAINPANGEKVPVWIGDYVLAGYGTGAVMAVPAHDERDFEFAKKYGLPIKQVIEPEFFATIGNSSVKKEMPFVDREAICAVVRNPKDDSYLCLEWKAMEARCLITGGIDDGEDVVRAAEREVCEETGYKNLRLVSEPKWVIHTYFYHQVKKVNRHARFHYVFFDLINDERDVVDEKELAQHEPVWKKKHELKDFFNVEEGNFMHTLINNPDHTHTDDGILSNSGQYNGLASSVARRKITEAVGGKIVTKYKMRDAIFARQRYWGEPIPLKTNKDTGIISVLPQSKLPLVLPNVISYEPTGTGESPLAAVKSWMKDGYETNTMPGWAGSSWYFLRYMDPKNSKEFASKKALSYWKDVDMYVGGQEHATGHLLYSRFWHKFLYDMKYVPTKEPFKTLKNQGLIIASDNRKMSKRWGNVINPDDIVKTYGADTLRVYEMFMGPFDQSVAWSTDSIIGSRRFLEKVWRGALSAKTQNIKKTDSSLEKLLHKTIKKVGADIETMNFNTAISSMMVLMNAIEESNTISIKDYKLFLSVLSPFAPHMTEELFREFGEKKSIHMSAWPTYDTKKVVDEEIKIMLQINGKVRSELMIPRTMEQKDIEKHALANSVIAGWVAGKEIRRIIYVPGRLMNIVI